MMPVTTSYNSDHYVQRLDLSADPFADDFESDYFYSGAQRRQILDQLIHFSRFSDQVVLLVGATGSGTSWLVDHAYSQLADVMDCCFVDAETAMSDQQLMASVNEQLQLNLNTPITAAEFIAAVQAITHIDDEPEPILLVIDQAHYMSLESYVLLRELVQQNGDFVRLLMVGEYQVEQLAVLSQFDKQQIKRLELEPLTLEETGNYLQGLLQSVGYAGEQPLGADQLAVLHEQSGGNLAEIDQLLPTLLSGNVSEQQSSLGRAIPVTHFAVIGLLLMALLLAWLYQSPMNDVINSDDEKEAEKLIAKIPAEKNSNGMVQRQVTLPPANKSPSAVASKPIATIQSLKEVPGEDAPKKQVVTAKPLPVNERQVAKSPVVEKLPAQEAAKVEEKISAAKSEPTVAKVSAKPVAKVIESAPIKKAVAAKPKVPAREQRLLGMPASSYVLQLMGSVDEKRVKDFVKPYEGRLPITYFETQLKGKPWFVALAAPYSNKAEALAASKVLPLELQKLRPWARSIEGIQADIRKHRR
ncbi:SPOR domain-containing protein [Oceanicoccus sp. KOV_DT_Chl]|uniref:SPOR domain-containing protein n=1 Tax=Oceanicoccus sp. KOV_DT_Chl TaxID=1904639 RepID=UPI000C7C2D3B|nr:AAA family ATPase [Oceanicoccus sp. KOV_DT_Chl]